MVPPGPKDACGVHFTDWSWGTRRPYNPADRISIVRASGGSPLQSGGLHLHRTGERRLAPTTPLLRGRGAVFRLSHHPLAQGRAADACPRQESRRWTRLRAPPARGNRVSTTWLSSTARRLSRFLAELRTAHRAANPLLQTLRPSGPLQNQAAPPWLSAGVRGTRRTRGGPGRHTLQQPTFNVIHVTSGCLSTTICSPSSR